MDIERRSLSLHNLSLAPQWPPEQLLALSEAISWLIQEGLLVQQPGQQAGWFVPSRRARSIHTKSDVESYIRGRQLPRVILHPSIVQQSYSDFMRGDYTGAVFKAFREALSNLFAGAIGTYKNPSSQRRVDLDASQAIVMLILVSHLLKIVEAQQEMLLKGRDVAVELCSD
jgi:hypothetical protein